MNQPSTTKRLSSMNLYGKLVCLILGLIIFPLGIFGTLLFSLQQNITSNYSISSLEISVAQMTDRISSNLASINMLTNLYYLDDSVSSILLSESGPDAKKIKDLCTKYAHTLGLLHTDVSFLTKNQTLYGARTALPEGLEDLLAIPSYSVRWFTSYDLPSAPYVDRNIYVVRSLHSRSDWSQVGTLIVFLPSNELRKICSGYLTETQNAYLLDRNGNILMSVNNQGLREQPSFDECKLISGTFFSKSGEHTQIVSYNTVNTTGWILAITSDYNAMQEPYTQTNRFFLAILLVYFSITLVLATVIAKRFVRPIRQLQNNIALVKKGNLDTMVPVTSADEIGQLSEQYNEMLQRIKELMNELVDTAKAKHDAEMQALQAQINPHFIYNALASIRFLVFAKRNEDADLALRSLVNILRGTLSDPRVLSTVGQEINLIKDYIQLQYLTFSKTLDVSFDIDDAVVNSPLCKLTLQPIVENAFSHGFAPGQEICKIDIQAKKYENCAKITISDNGVGFVCTSFPPKRNKQSNSLHTGLGLSNVHERLRLVFGPEYGISLDSAPGAGTRVTITIPLHHQEGDTLIYDSSDR